MTSPRDGDGAPAVGERGLATLATLLSGVAGYVDALGWVLLSQVYVANMSGNTIALGRGLAELDLRAAAARLWPIVIFVLGLFASELAYELARRRGHPSSAGWTLGLEASAIAFVLVLPWPPAQAKLGILYYLPTGLLAFAMGLQNATLVRIGASSVYTTHVTGNLTRLAREAAHALLSIGERRRREAEARRRSARRVLLMTLLWLAYMAGAILGALAAARWNRHGAVAAVVVLTILVAVDAFAPIGGHEAPPEPHPMF